MGPAWDWQDPGGHRVGPINPAIWVDLAYAFWQLGLHPDTQRKTGWITKYSLNRLTFGLKDAPFAFAQSMYEVLTGIVNIFCIVYIDDIIIFLPDNETHPKHLVLFCYRLCKHNLTLKSSNCNW